MFNSKFNGKKLERNHKVKKTFDYRKDTASLSFTIDIENKSAMQDFVALLKEATLEVEEEINKLN